MGRWAECRVEVAAEAGEAVSALFSGLGAGGVVWEDGAGRPVVITAYFPDDGRLGERLQRLEAGLADLPRHGLGTQPGRLQVRWVDEEDWAHSWKAHFHPLPVGRRLLIQPSWEQGDPGDRIPVLLDPGMAFGTGRHPSTRLCLTFLEDLVEPGMVCADIGTGSGILAIAAALLGAGRCVGVDLDPTAVQVAAENAEANGVGDKVVFATGSAAEARRRLEGGQAPLVVANITAEVLIALGEGLVQLVAPGGVLVLSGIVEPKAGGVQRVFEGLGLVLEETRQEAEWVALAFRAPGRG